jgi:hypothetical protein
VALAGRTAPRTGERCRDSFALSFVGENVEDLRYESDHIYPFDEERSRTFRGDLKFLNRTLLMIVVLFLRVARASKTCTDRSFPPVADFDF